MRVRDAMTQNVRSIDANGSLTEAATIMKNEDVGYLPVMRSDRPAGVVSDRDIVIRAVAAGMDPAATTVDEIMTGEVFTCHSDDDIADAAELMKSKKIRRLLVLDDDDQPAGVLSLGDIAESRDADVAEEVIEEVCRP
ncbi:MAG: CBS domain-containing protein [Planctomycetaceae bacterium]|nr:CBS domain-containing protein [Planctomycetaceae bacterium]